MNKWLISVISTSFLATTALADDDTESAVDSKWAFGLQAAPLIFGLSLRRQLTDKWYVQGLLNRLAMMCLSEPDSFELPQKRSFGRATCLLA